MTVLVTGGTGFIGSHQVAALAGAGERSVIVDNGSNSDFGHVLTHLAELTGCRPSSYLLDVHETERLVSIIRRHDVSEVIHLSAMKDLRESVHRVDAYHHSNVGGLASVIDACEATGVRRLVFSSSGSVYGTADQFPIDETAPHRPTNPYSVSKSLSEQQLADICASDPRWSVVALRYFNPAGADPSALIGEAPTRRRTNLLPMLLDVASGIREAIDVFGGDFDTPDGTGIRDYVHVSDVADAHLAALEHVRVATGFQALNIGRGEGVSVLDLIKTVESVTKRPVPFRVRDRRPGDVGALVGSTDRARAVLGVSATKDLPTIVADAWRWQVRTTDPTSCWASPGMACRMAS